MKRQIKALSILLLAIAPVWAAGSDSLAGEEVVRLPVEIQALSAQSRQPEPARVAACGTPRPTPLPSTQLFMPLGESCRAGHHWNALLAYYDGPSPYGQFYPQDVRYWGAAIQSGL